MDGDIELEVPELHTCKLQDVDREFPWHEVYQVVLVPYFCITTVMQEVQQDFA